MILWKDNKTAQEEELLFDSIIQLPAQKNMYLV